MVEMCSLLLCQSCPHPAQLSRTAQLILRRLRYRESLGPLEESCNSRKKKCLWKWRWNVREMETSVAKIVLHSHSPANKNTINKVALQ